MSFVDFMIIGAMKCGTTTLAEILSNHPDVCFSRQKEPHFFSKNTNWRNCLEEYQSLYQPNGQQICGEASTTYTFYPQYNACPEIYQFNPNLKLIYMMRNPVDRVVSQYLHCYSRGYTSLPLEKAILSSPGYINITRYYIQIRPYLELFGEQKVLLLTLEEFLGSKRDTLTKIANFLNIDPEKFGDFEQIHANKSIGEAKRNMRVKNIGHNSIISSIKPYIPKTLREITTKGIHKLTARKIAHKPDLSDSLKKIINDLLILDVLEIEKIMGRKIEEWDLSSNTVNSSSSHYVNN